MLGLALWTGNPLWPRRETQQARAVSHTRVFCLPGMHTIAAQLLGSGASINDTMSSGHTLLHMAIQRQDSKSALFLLEHQADINMRYRPHLARFVLMLLCNVGVFVSQDAGGGNSAAAGHQ